MAKRDLGPVVIEWLDATGPFEGTWIKYNPKVHKPAKMRSVGYLVAERDTYIVIAADYCAADKTYCGINCIPRSMIKKLTK